MTDREKLLALLADFGVTPTQFADVWRGEPMEFVTLEAQEGGVQGYSYFECQFAFTKDGTFQSVGVWE